MQKIAFGFKDEHYFYRRLCKKNGWNFDLLIDKNHSFYKCIKDIHTIILAPQALEFQFRPAQANETYFHVPMQKNEEKYKTPQYKQLLFEIEKLRENDKFKAIYVAFGTLSAMDFQNIYSFLVRLINALKDERDILLVVSEGGLEIFCFDGCAVAIVDPFNQHLLI